MKIQATQQTNSGSEKSTRSNQASQQTILQAFKAGTMQLKTDEERAAKHQRIALAKTEIAGKSIDSNLEKHLFEGHPTVGDFDVHSPTGLHAYTDGRFPTKNYKVKRGRVETNETTNVVSTVSGNPNKIHTIDWKWDKSGDDIDLKSSTMFPQNMPKQHVIALVAGGLTSKTDEYIKHGMTFGIEKKGGTAYPVTE
ncbi:EndoU domain-containing protein [Fluviicola chungangensis]|uniref:Uncharacterized protein n=1 Tax=Fluviicola chungangensis TaxID=2597671 RepID=A0A556MYM5_9FLAO|nr:EndoU domain-containing protein [Fluviicola chungangensis]TSJ44928.1 hypothetical protein FO442_10045 [Fluviicola chungangensis]